MLYHPFKTQLIRPVPLAEVAFRVGVMALSSLCSLVMMSLLVGVPLSTVTYTDPPLIVVVALLLPPCYSQQHRRLLSPWTLRLPRQLRLP